MLYSHLFVELEEGTENQRTLKLVYSTKLVDKEKGDKFYNVEPKQ